MLVFQSGTNYRTEKVGNSSAESLDKIDVIKAAQQTFSRDEPCLDKYDGTIEKHLKYSKRSKI